MLRLPIRCHDAAAAMPAATPLPLLMPHCQRDTLLIYAAYTIDYVDAVLILRGALRRHAAITRRD